MRTDDHHIEKHNGFLAIKDKHEIRLVFLGDSLTRRWEDNIDLWHKYFSEYAAVNLGVGGDCLENIKWRVLNGELDDMAPKVMVILAGTNNLDQDSVETIVRGIQEIAEITHQKLGNAKVVVLGLLPRNNNETGINYRQKIEQINGRLSSLFAGTDIQFRDIGADLMDGQGVVSDEIMPDGLHLNRKGYDVIGPRLKAIIDEFW
jgi:lysophospholipase L1-like esterase